MKLTKTRLKKIIKKELTEGLFQKLFQKEDTFGMIPEVEEVQRAIKELADDFINRGLDPAALRWIIIEYAESIEDQVA